MKNTSKVKVKPMAYIPYPKGIGVLRHFYKIVSAEEAVRIIRNNDTVAFGGFVGIGFAEEIAIELERFFLETGQPKDLSLVFAAGQGDGKHRGLNHLAHQGMIKRIIGGHWGLAPKLQELAMSNKVEAYNLPQGGNFASLSRYCRP